MVPVAGVEPARCRHHWILSPARLPIPSHRLIQTAKVLYNNPYPKIKTYFLGMGFFVAAGRGPRADAFYKPCVPAGRGRGGRLPPLFAADGTGQVGTMFFFACGFVLQISQLRQMREKVAVGRLTLRPDFYYNKCVAFRLLSGRVDRCRMCAANSLRFGANPDKTAAKSPNASRSSAALGWRCFYDAFYKADLGGNRPGCRRS